MCFKDKDQVYVLDDNPSTPSIHISTCHTYQIHVFNFLIIKFGLCDYVFAKKLKLKIHKLTSR